MALNEQLLSDNYTKIWESPKNKSVVSSVNKNLDDLDKQARPSSIIGGLWHEMKRHVYEDVLNDRTESATYQTTGHSFSIDYE